MALERYQLIAELGRGGTADVYLAIARGLSGFNKLVVVKSLRGADDDQIDMFLDEGRLAARLSHPNVVQTNEVGREGENHYLVMEFLDGQTLRKLSRSHFEGPPLPQAIHLRIISDALSGLHYAHTLTDFDGTPLGIVHRDVSPHNIFVTYDGVTKLLDFGIAKAASRVVETTRTGMLKGKVAYMAPEQALGVKQIDGRADVFAVGVMLFEAASGERLWKNLNEFEVLRRLDHGKIPRLEEVAPDAPAWLRPICDRALAFKADDRYATAAELQQALEDGMEANGIRVTQKDVAKWIGARYTEERDRLRKAIETRIRELPKLESDVTVAFDKVPRLVSGSGGFEAASERSPEAVSRRTDDHRVWPPIPIEVPPEPDEPRAQTLTGQRGAMESPVEAATPLSRARIGVIAAAAIAVVLFLVFGLSTMAPPATATDAAPPTSPGAALEAGTGPQTSAAVASSVATSSPDVAEASVAKTTVAIDLEAVPKEAKLFLDDHEIANPTHLTVPRDAKQHEIRAQMSGRRTEVTRLTFDHDQSAKLTLEKLSTPPPSGSFVKPPVPPSALPSATVVASPTKPDCSNPFYIDERGIKTLRPECR